MNIKVVRGNPTPEELAAALAVVRARASVAPETDAPKAKDAWSDPARIAARGVPRAGATAWARTYWPK
ncbi:acyl-CoA carboxylase epsilon subunit [Streptomyces acidiscabies]|uniref:Acyl-CoA carboxylase epsilon subunit n=1 Tax=Streptomyces acidiscabies TaxID=42234 RepID=A0AAP6EKN0_9ACTN|nr:acyl-CoA carboxylase epsilon subunit [Streptomyces acidiscabies]MBP5937315.1 acyl-CoA carboxylase subunit epsilon [Streptomyces sp. LBUM 1476]MBZ3914617.1 acyl-CoA carboxylase subunit epsilon [Streptomyces acidiscabies]MDX2966168.1 acyl-CoA carboxylase epsilon subunit [Streptomyces acidiscabies]MDX3025563.1 acyl-CoA carboxylase epsilon subunit [Streptomyces acidiscabies]MDX3796160.1 acyl-CoA carboxylase epsilon subunit [Streptomyces acidiscabies]